MFGNAPRAVWQKWCEPDELGRIRLQCRCMLLQVDGKNILFETGVGAFFEPKLKDRFGVVEEEHMLLKNLNALGVSEDQIDVVVLTHLHFDHAGGLLSKYNSKKSPHLLFPNARYIVGEDAFARSLKPHFRDRASFIDFLPKLLTDSGRLEVIKDRSTKIAGFEGVIEFIYSDGHTPGHMHSLIQGDNLKVFYAGDLIPGIAWLHLPITMGYDRYAEKVIDEKKELIGRGIDENWLFFFTHDENYAACHATLNERKRFEPKSKLAEMNSLEI